MRQNFTEIKPETHDSYGIISLTRTTGTPRPLFGSTIRHGDTIILTISEAKVYRDFQRNRYMDSKHLIKVEMSQSQFAEAITTMNVGCGIPVTLRYVLGEKREEPPETDFRKRAQSELKSEMSELGDRIEELSKDAKEILTRKGPISAADKKKLLDDLNALRTEVESNIPFAHECFQEAVEETITDAKAEVDTCLTSMRERIGQAALDGKIQVPDLLSSPLKDDNA